MIVIFSNYIITYLFVNAASNCYKDFTFDLKNAITNTKKSEKIVHIICQLLWLILKINWLINMNFTYTFGYPSTEIYYNQMFIQSHRLFKKN
jgi:hypothetical protein